MNIRWLTDYSKEFLSKDYLLPNQTVEDRIKIIGDNTEKILGIKDYSFKLQQYIANGWISLSTPIWINYGTNRGLPISCFGSLSQDSIESILDTASEIGTMTKHGGGTSLYLGELRGRGSKITDNGTSNGSFSFLELYQAVTGTISQGSSRRGYLAVCQDIEHSDIEEWLNIRQEGNPIQQLTWAVNVGSDWLNGMKEGDTEKRKLWAKVIQKRFETGLPYIFFKDNVNNSESTPEVYKGKNLIKASNLCHEITLPSDKDTSFVCCLASINDLYYDEWKDTDCVEVVTFLLDAVMTEFIEKASKLKHFEKAVNFAKNHRALGIGRLGYHSYLQSKMIPFESLEARLHNVSIQKTIQLQALEASKKLTVLFGECEWTKGTGRRNTTLQAIAPTTSSAFILGQVSQSIEPYDSNYYIKDLAKGKFVIKNPYLQNLLIEKNKNTDEVWNSIMKEKGSVLHLDFLTDEEKLVFKTSREINQEEIIIQAAHRQKYIDQSQSLNLFITADTTAKEVNRLLLLAHDMGIKTLYYQHNVNKASEFARKFAHCISCE